jgi:hypothetical protein
VVAGYIDHPGKQSSLGRVVSVDLVPEFQENILQRLLGNLLAANDAQNNSINRARVMIVQVVQRAFVFRLQSSDQFVFGNMVDNRIDRLMCDSLM